MLTGAPLLEELDRVLRYPRLQRYYTDEARRRYVALIGALSEVSELPESVPRVCLDPQDDWVVACAVAGRADLIASGDRDPLGLRRVGEIPILSASQFLAYLEEHRAMTTV